MTHTPSALTVESRMADILKWKSQIVPPTPSIPAIRYDKDGAPTTRSDALPHGIQIDTASSDGTRGIISEQGVEAVLSGLAMDLAGWLSEMTGDTHQVTGDPGPWIHAQLRERPVLRHIHVKPEALPEDATPEERKAHEWAMWDYSLWESYSHEVTALWWKVGRLTGHAPESRTRCPRCRNGWLRSEWDKHGLEDIAACSNPDCDTKVDYSKGEATNSYRATLRSEDMPDDIYLPLAGVLSIWPSLKPGTVFKWAQRGQVRRNQQGYNLADINRRKWGNK